MRTGSSQGSMVYAIAQKGMMVYRSKQRRSGIGESAWAHYRWPRIGGYAGAGVGLVLGIVRVAGWSQTIGMLVLLGVSGGLIGFILAKLVYRYAEDEMHR